MTNLPKKAMILAAGEGTRLRPLTLDVPKPMVPILGVPLLARTLLSLASAGIYEVAVNLFHRPQSIFDFFGDVWHGVKLTYFFEDVLRGTAGGVKAARSLLSDAPFFVIYGDNSIDANLSNLVERHFSRDADATLALFSHPNPSAAGIVATNADGRITRFVEKPAPDAIFSDQANAGIYLLSPLVFDFIPDGVPSDFGRDVFPAMLAANVKLFGVPLDGKLSDTGTPETYRKANFDALGDGNLWTGERVELGENVMFIGKNVIGDSVKIGKNATLTNCIMWDGVTIGDGATLENAILARGVTIGKNVTLPPGKILGSGESA